MSQLTNIDEYAKLMPLDADQLEAQGVQANMIERIARLRGLYYHWLKFPNKSENEIVQYDIAMFNVKRTRAYDDLTVLRTLIGVIQKPTREFMRWKINKDLEHDRELALKRMDMRALAAIEKARIANNRTDKDEEAELEFDAIVPQTFEPTDDPTVIGIARQPDLRAKMARMKAHYSKTNIQDAQYMEVEDDGDNDE